MRNLTGKRHICHISQTRNCISIVEIPSKNSHINTTNPMGGTLNNVKYRNKKTVCRKKNTIQIVLYSI